MSVDDGDRPLQLQLWHRCEHSVEEFEHFPVGVRAAAEQDDARAVSALDREQSGVVKISRHDDAPLLPGGVEDLLIGGCRESDQGGVGAVMPGAPKMRNRIRRHRHVHEKSHPLNSMTSSSARLAA